MEMRMSFGAMLPAVFVDTSAWVAYYCARDPRHAEAKAAFARLGSGEDRRIFLTSDYVVAETVTRLRYDHGYKIAVQAWDELDAEDVAIVEAVTENHLRQAKAIFNKYRDQMLSVTDAASFALMREMKIVDALTFDGHFRVAGFVLHPE